MQECSLFEQKLLTHRDDPDTSEAAAKELVESGELSRQENEVYQALVKYDRLSGFTMKELSEISGIDYYTCQRRISGLYRKSKVTLLSAIREGCRVWRKL